MQAFSFSRSPARAAPNPLLLNDADDALVPLRAPTPPESAATPVPVECSQPASELRLTHPACADARTLQKAIDWVCSPEPALGARCALLYLTGINLGPSRRERRLRSLFCELYQSSYDQKEDV